MRTAVRHILVAAALTLVALAIRQLSNRPPEAEALPRVFLRETPPTLRQVESPEIVKL